MISRFFFGLITILTFNTVTSQVSVADVKLYKTSEDFFNNKVWDVDVSLLIQEEGNRHLEIEDFISPKTRKKFKEGISAWAIEYRGHKYFNMAYHVYSKWRVYVKFDIIGEYSTIFIDENTDKKVGSLVEGNYGGGLQGLIFQSLATNEKGNNNIDASGEAKGIYIIDSNQIYPKNGYRYKSCKARLLDAKELKRLYEKRYPDKRLKGKDRKLLTFNDIVEIIEGLNQK